jgi:hypothetical protein
VSAPDPFIEVLAEARAEIAAAAPDAETAAEGEAYLARLAASARAEGVLGHLLTERGLTRVLPTRGCPNPDYLMSTAPVSSDRRYAIEGALNGSERVGIGLYEFDSSGAAVLAGYAAFDRSSVGADGRFTLALGGDGEEPGRLAIPPAARRLIVRILHRDAGAASANLRLDGGEAPDLPKPETLAAVQIRSAQMLAGAVRQFLRWSAAMAAIPNRLAHPSAELAASVQGDPDTVYQLGGFALAPGEWLDIELPRGLAGYWSLHAYNFWGESLPGAGVHDRIAVAADDGVVRIALGANPPAGLPNRIDTLGRRRGILFLRAIGGAPAGLPATKVRQA